MRLVTYGKDGRDRLGVLSPDGTLIYDIGEAGFSFGDMNELIGKSDPELLKKIEEAVKNVRGIPYDAVEKRAPIPHPRQDVICLGKNYMDHAAEAANYENQVFGAMKEKPVSIYFSKRVNEAVPDGGPIPSHSDIEDRLDYEAELAVIIGKTASRVSREDAYDYVFGYTIINDMSARVMQTSHEQWHFSKSLDGFTPMGPAITTADEIPGKPELGIRSRINGELRQDSNTGMLIFDIAYVISELTHGMTLLPGTIISTGTPAGVGMGFDPPKFLKSGDIVECEIDKIGTLTNTIL